MTNLANYHLEVSLKDARFAKELLDILRFSADERLIQTSTNSYEIKNIDEGDDDDINGNWTFYSEIYDMFDKFGIEFFLTTQYQ